MVAERAAAAMERAARAVAAEAWMAAVLVAILEAIRRPSGGGAEGNHQG